MQDSADMQTSNNVPPSGASLPKGLSLVGSSTTATADGGGLYGSRNLKAGEKLREHANVHDRRISDIISAGANEDTF